MLHPVTSVTTRERPSPRAAASFRPSAHDKPQRHENCLRSTRKRPLRGLHEKRMGRLRRGTRKTATSKESVSPLFDNGLRIGAKIDEQTKLAAGQPKVIHQLRPSSHGVDASAKAALAARQMRRVSWSRVSARHAAGFVVARQRKFFPPRKGFCDIMQTIGHRRIVSSMFSK